jgi:hypothetical protein
VRSSALTSAAALNETLVVIDQVLQVGVLNCRGAAAAPSCCRLGCHAAASSRSRWKQNK